MSEKLDGVRGVWTGTRLLTRRGHPFVVPEEFTSKLPQGIELDGELFLERNNYEDAAHIVNNKNSTSEQWATIRYMIFDGPGLEGDFESRYKQLEQIIADSGNSQLELVEQVPLETVE